MRKLTLLLVTTFVLNSTPLFAHDSPSLLSNKPCHDHGIFSGINLTKEQHDKLHDIMAIRDNPGEIPKMQQNHQLITAATFDETTVKKQAEVMVNKRVAMLKIQNALYNMLTAEQKTIFNNNYEARLDRIRQHQTMCQQHKH